MAKDKSVSDVEKYMKIFAWAYRKNQKNYDRINSLQKSYDNTILDSVWPTTSKVPIASFFEAVEKQLPIVMDYMFGPSNRIRLMPLEPDIGMDQVRKSEMALWDLITYRMKLHRACIPTIKDVFKCGVGFGIVEPIQVSPPSSYGMTVYNEEKKATNTRVMEIGNPVETLRFRYLTPAQIVVTPDGSDFNGENPVSISFFFDSYNENQFRDMFDESKIDGERPLLNGNAEEIIAEARSSGFRSDTTVEELVNKVGGISPKHIKPDDEYAPCRVAVLKCYDRYERRHLWIANGTTIIYDVSDEYQTLRCPLIKASAWLDGTRFYPMSTPEAYERIGWTKNIVVNMFLDLMTKNLKRPLVYNSDMFDETPTFGPDDKIRTSAPDARLGAAYLEPARVDPSTFTFYEEITRIGEKLLGQKDFMDKNYARGGGSAFTELLATTEGMDRLKGMILDMTFLESTIQQAMIYLQGRIGQEPITVRQREKDKKTGEDKITELTVTEDDLCHGYELSVDLREKHRKGMMEQQASLQIYDRKIQSPFFDKWEVAAEHLCSSDEEIRRQLKSKEEVERIDREQQAMNAQAQAMQIQLEQNKLAGAQKQGEVPAEQQMMGVA